MVVNDFKLPEAFVQLCAAIQRGEAPTDWVLKENVDAYAQSWEDVDLRIHCDLEEIQSDTDWLSEAFLHEERLQHRLESASQPGFVSDFTGVANFVWFASGTDGLPYAFDFGTDTTEPSVVHWEGYWRRVAPNFESFITLFIDKEEVLWDDEHDEEDEDLETTKPTGRTLLRNYVPLYVVGVPGASDPSFFPELAAAYAEISPEERQAVEAEVRENLKRDEAGGMKMTDEDRRRLEEVWQRLRASLPS